MSRKFFFCHYYFTNFTSIKNNFHLSKMANQSSCVLAVVFHPEPIHTSNTDDFKVIFDHLGIKIFAGILYFCLFFISNGNQVFLITYDKNHIDPMKRSVVDHILPFMGYVVIMHNLVCGSLWTWRILIGPLNFEVAEFEG